MTKAMILAAGRGTRLKELTQNTPKPLVPVAGVAPLKRTLSLLAEQGFTQGVVNAWYLAPQIKAAVESMPNLAMSVVEENELLDTGGGVKNALPYLGSAPFVVVNGDLIWSEETHPILAQLPDLFDPQKMDALLLLMPRAQALGYHKNGDFTMKEDGQLALKTSAESDAPYVYCGIQVLSPRVFDAIDKSVFSLIDVYRLAQKQGRLYGHVYQGEWVDMGTPDGMQHGADLMRRLCAANVA